MKRLLLLILLALPVCMIAQTYTQPYSKREQKLAKRWAKRGTWRNGFTKANPDKTVNLVDFRHQVERNPEQWNALFAWLQKTDLMALPAGKTPIEGTTLVANVQDDTNSPLEKRQSESHRRNIDFQYVVSGTEGFALLDHDTSKPKMAYNEAKDLIRYDFDPARTKFFTNTEGCFNIFFPGDWHIAKVRQDDGKHFRVIVIKVEWKD